LAEYLFSLHPKVYYRASQTKFLLYENIKNTLPAEILKRPKQGFVGPDSYYMDIAFYANCLRDGQLIKSDVISPAGLERLLRDKDHWRLWKLIVLEKWWQRWMT
jgi:asparagine synthase (glutamine-hydrolysing)